VAADRRRGERYDVRVVGLEEFPDWVDLIALGVLFGQGAVWTRIRIR
jgi:hypothetical protein